MLILSVSRFDGAVYAHFQAVGLIPANDNGLRGAR